VLAFGVVGARRCLEVSVPKFLRNSLVAVGVLAIAYYIAFSLDYLPRVLNFFNDDDRPPIIVSTGSMEVEALFDDKDMSRGRFDAGGATQSQTWTHKHDGKSVKKFSVVLTDATGAGCSAAVIYKKVTKVTVNYTEPVKGTNINKMLLVSIIGDDLVLTFPDAVAPSLDYFFRLENATLKSVVFEGDPMGNGGSQPFTCDLGANGSVEIRQRNK